MSQVNLSPQEIAKRGEAIYDRKLRAVLERDHPGEFLALDILSESYRVAESDLIATKLLLEEAPQAVIYGLKIGSTSAYRIGRFFSDFSLNTCAVPISS